MSRMNLWNKKKQLLEVGRGSYLLNKSVLQKKILKHEPHTN